MYCRVHNSTLPNSSPIVGQLFHKIVQHCAFDEDDHQFDQAGWSGPEVVSKLKLRKTLAIFFLFFPGTKNAQLCKLIMKFVTDKISLLLWFANCLDKINVLASPKSKFYKWICPFPLLAVGWSSLEPIIAELEYLHSFKTSDCSLCGSQRQLYLENGHYGTLRAGRRVISSYGQIIQHNNAMHSQCHQVQFWNFTIL